MPEMNRSRARREALALRPGLQIIYTTGYTLHAVCNNASSMSVTASAQPFNIDHSRSKVRQTVDSR